MKHSRRWRKRGEWRRRQLLLEATWGNLFETPLENVGASHRRYQKNDILVVFLQGRLCYTDNEPHILKFHAIIVASTWTHPWVQQRLVVGGCYFFSTKSTLPTPPTMVLLGGLGEIFLTSFATMKKTIENWWVFPFESWCVCCPFNFSPI